MNTIENCKIVELPKIQDPRGNLSFIEEEVHFPFEIKRAYWIYDVPGGQIRGGHAFKKQHEMIVALSGSLDVFVDDGLNKKGIPAKPIILWTIYTFRNLETNGEFLN